MKSCTESACPHKKHCQWLHQQVGTHLQQKQECGIHQEQVQGGKVKMQGYCSTHMNMLAVSSKSKLWEQ